MSWVFTGQYDASGQPLYVSQADAGATSATASGDVGVNAGLPQDQWTLDYLLQTGQLGVSQGQLANSQQQTANDYALGSYNAQTQRANDMGTLYVQTYHQPLNYAAQANLTTGQTRPASLGFYDALMGITPGVQNTTVPQDQQLANASNPDNTGVSTLFNGGVGSPSADGGSSSGGGGGSEMDWKNERGAAGITADASNPEIDRMFKSGTPVADPAALQSLTVNQPMQASAFYGNRSSEGVPVVGAQILDPTTLTYRAATPADVTANEAAAANDAQGGSSSSDNRNQNEDSRSSSGDTRSSEAQASGSQPTQGSYGNEQADTTYQNSADTGGDTRRYAAGGARIVPHPVTGQPMVVHPHPRYKTLLRMAPQMGGMPPMQAPLRSTPGPQLPMPGDAAMQGPNLALGPSRMAAGGMHLVTRPEHMAVGGRQAVVGEHGRDELVMNTPRAGMVFPLQNPRVQVSPWAAAVGNRMAPGTPYHPHPGAAPGALSHQHGVLPVHVHMADGGVVYGGGSPGVIAPGATISPQNQAYDDGSYISGSGQVKAYSGDGNYTEIPQFQNEPLLQATSQTPSFTDMALKDPLQAALMQSILEAKGVDFGSWENAYAQSKPYMSQARPYATLARGAY